MKLSTLFVSAAIVSISAVSAPSFAATIAVDDDGIYSNNWTPSFNAFDPEFDENWGTLSMSFYDDNFGSCYGLSADHGATFAIVTGCSSNIWHIYIDELQYNLDHATYIPYACYSAFLPGYDGWWSMTSTDQACISGIIVGGGGGGC